MSHCNLTPNNRKKFKLTDVETIYPSLLLQHAEALHDNSKALRDQGETIKQLRLLDRPLVQRKSSQSVSSSIDNENEVANLNLQSTSSNESIVEENTSGNNQAITSNNVTISNLNGNRIIDSRRISLSQSSVNVVEFVPPGSTTNNTNGIESNNDAVEELTADSTIESISLDKQPVEKESNFNSCLNSLLRKLHLKKPNLKYDDEAMRKAIKAILIDRMKYKAAADQHKIPPTTLYGYAKKYEKLAAKKARLI